MSLAIATQKEDGGGSERKQAKTRNLNYLHEFCRQLRREFKCPAARIDGKDEIDKFENEMTSFSSNEKKDENTH